jgi:hypothetical protein
MGILTEEGRKAVELGLTRWREDRRKVDEVRDRLVWGAVGLGISKHRVHVLTGLARTTIDGILKDHTDEVEAKFRAQQQDSARRQGLNPA